MGVTAHIELDDDLLDELADRLEERLGARPRYFSKTVLCASLGVTERTLRTWRTRGLPAIRVGKALMYDMTAVERWIEGHA